MANSPAPPQQRSFLPHQHVINPLFTPFRSSYRPRRSSHSPAVGHCCPLPYPSGDGSTVPAISIRSRILTPVADQASVPLADPFSPPRPSVQLRRRASLASYSPRIAGNMDARETPIHEISKTALNGLTQLISSGGLKRTASNLFTSVVRIGSGIINTGIQAASNFLNEIDPDVPVREDEMSFRGFEVKASGNSLTIRSIHAEEPRGVRVTVDLDPRLSSSPPAPVYTRDQLKLNFGFENSIAVTTPAKSFPGDIKWTNEENLIILHLQ